MSVIDADIELVHIGSDSSTASITGELIVRIQPTIGFKNFVVAVSAGNFDAAVLDFFKNSQNDEQRDDAIRRKPSTLGQEHELL